MRRKPSSSLSRKHRYNSRITSTFLIGFLALTLPASAILGASYAALDGTSSSHLSKAGSATTFSRHTSGRKMAACPKTELKTVKRAEPESAKRTLLGLDKAVSTWG